MAKPTRGLHPRELMAHVEKMSRDRAVRALGPKEREQLTVAANELEALLTRHRRAFALVQRASLSFLAGPKSLVTEMRALAAEVPRRDE
jgi:hypothetical protein